MAWGWVGFVTGMRQEGKGGADPSWPLVAQEKREAGGGGSHSCLAVVLRVILFGWALLGWVLVGDQNANRRGKRRGNIILEVTWITDVLQLFYFIVF